MSHTPPPPPPRWLWFAAIAGLASLASLTLSAGHDPPPGPQVPAEAPQSGSADEHPAATLPDAAPTFDRRCQLCPQPLF